MPVDTERRVREILYSLLLPIIDDQAPDALAHRLIYGNLDARIDTITKLEKARKKALPVLHDFLRNDEPLIREATADSILKASPTLGPKILAEHLKTEQGQDVVLAILRGLGDVEGDDSLTILASYLSHESEQLILASLNSLARLEANNKAVNEGVIRCLQDERWRVRAGALEVVQKASDEAYGKHVLPLLKDDDDFVRFGAVQAVSSMRDSNVTEELDELFHDSDDLKGPVVAAFLSLDNPIPESFTTALRKADADVVLSVLSALNKADANELGLAQEFAAHGNLDVACTALRILAQRGMSSPPTSASCAMRSIRT